MQRWVARLVREPIDVAALVREVEHPGCGAIATFVGVVRAERRDDAQLAALDYSAYEPMALSEMERIAAAAAAAHEIHAIRVVHRLGRMEIGEASVALVVSAPHRAAAFDACRAIIERLKVSVPIFKRECWSDESSTWVDPL